MSESKFIEELGRELSGRPLDIYEGRSGLAPYIEEQYRNLWRTMAGKEPKIVPCRFHGKYTGETITCEPCGGNVHFKLFECSHPKHKGICTLEMADTSVPNCKDCRWKNRDPEPERTIYTGESGIVIGTYGMPQLARLQVELIRETCGDVPILIADDGSNRDAEFQAIADAHPGVEFWPSDQRKGHYSGDLSVFWKGFQWAHTRGIKHLVKLSQRFLWTEPGWLENVTSALKVSGEATIMQDCIDNGGGNVQNCRLFVRSECMGFDVAKWMPHYKEFDTGGELNNPTELYVWHRVHAYFGEKYCPWPGMTIDRYQATPGAIWHGSHNEHPYRELAAARGIDLGAEFTCVGSQSLPDWKRG